MLIARISIINPKPQDRVLLKKGIFLLIDVWGKEKQERTVFGDICRVGVAREHPTEREKRVFDIVRSAQKAGISLVKRRFAEKKKVLGFEVDDAVMGIIKDA